jgi:hypothetical protein
MILVPSGDQPGVKAKERLPPIWSGIFRRPVPLGWTMDYVKAPRH